MSLSGFVNKRRRPHANRKFSGRRREKLFGCRGDITPLGRQRQLPPGHAARRSEVFEKSAVSDGADGDVLAEELAVEECAGEGFVAEAFPEGAAFVVVEVCGN